MNICLILGSIRTDRESVKPALYIKRKLEETSHTITFIDLKELDLPVYDESPELVHLPSAQQLLQFIVDADALVLVFPEYNHNIGSAMINAVEFLRHRELLHKPVGLVGVSNGAIGGARALLIARGSLPTLGAVILPTTVQVSTVQDSFPDQFTCADGRINTTINRMIKELVSYGNALQAVRKELAR